MAAALLDIADSRGKNESCALEIILKHSLPQALSGRNGKGFNYRQLDLKSPSGGDLRLQSWREELEMCVLGQLVSAWVGGLRGTQLKNLSLTWACTFYEGLWGPGAVNTQLIPTQQRYTECPLCVRFLLGMGDSVVNEMDNGLGLTKLMI